MSRPGASVNRNAPCPCGSGRKYKKCCYGKAPAATAGGRVTTPDDTMELLRTAFNAAKADELDAAADLGVRHDHLHVVGGVQDCHEDADLLDRSGDPGGVDEVSDPERTEDQQHHARGEIRERPLECQPHGKSGRTDHRCETCCFDSKDTQATQYRQQ